MRDAVAAPWPRITKDSTMTTNYATDTTADERAAEFAALLARVPADEREAVLDMLWAVIERSTVAG